jgi:hypothetical protein
VNPTTIKDTNSTPKIIVNAIAAEIQSGEITHNQDHVITPISFSAMKRMVRRPANPGFAGLLRRPANPIPPLDLVEQFVSLILNQL